MLILDLGTGGLCAREKNPEVVHASVCNLVREFPEWGITPEVIVFLPILPRTVYVSYYDYIGRV